MSIVFNGPPVQYIPLVYLRPDPLSTDRHIFQYPVGTDFSAFKAMYYKYNQTVCQVPSDAFLVMLGNRLRLSIKNFYASKGFILKLLCDTTNQRGLDFVDRFGLAGTVYNYATITVTNQSYYSRLTNTFITSEDLAIGFDLDYPAQYPHTQFINGQAYAVTDSGKTALGFNFNNLQFSAFFNCVYAGNIAGNGRINGYNTPKAGLLEVLYQGKLEFALSMSGPWYSILSVPEVPRRQSLTCYVRCGQIITALQRYLNSVKIFTTEAI